jgi:YHS domain-containing protein
MAEINTLVERIRREFATQKQQVKASRDRYVAEHKARESRQETLEQTLDKLRDVWRPRLESFAKEFGESIMASPTVSPGLRSATFAVKSPLASIRMTFTAAANSDVTELVLSYDLQILPILMKFERHAELAFPLDQVNPEKIGDWIDDRLVGFVRTYLEMQSNEYYLKDQMVEDPVAHVRLPKFAAEATRERDGVKYYFVSEETAAEFAKQALATS